MSAADPFPSEPPALELRVEREDGSCVVVVLEGELDISTVDAVRAEVLGLAARGCRSLVLDLSRLTFADSCEIHLLLDLETAAAVNGFAFALHLGEATPARHLLAMAGLEERFPLA
jgi:anti-anti-sigma factor